MSGGGRLPTARVVGYILIPPPGLPQALAKPPRSQSIFAFDKAEPSPILARLGARVSDTVARNPLRQRTLEFLLRLPTTTCG